MNPDILQQVPTVRGQRPPAARLRHPTVPDQPRTVTAKRDAEVLGMPPLRPGAMTRLKGHSTTVSSRPRVGLRREPANPATTARRRRLVARTGRTGAEGQDQNCLHPTSLPDPHRGPNGLVGRPHSATARPTRSPDLAQHRILTYWHPPWSRHHIPAWRRSNRPCLSTRDRGSAARATTAVDEAGRPRRRGRLGQIRWTLAAWRPLGPRLVSNSTFWPSSRLR